MGSTRTRIVARLSLVAALALASFAGGCDCGQPPVHTTHDGGTGCTTDQECQTQHGSRYTCNKTDHTCVKGPRYCDTSGEDQCCPGQVSNPPGSASTSTTPAPPTPTARWPARCANQDGQRLRPAGLHLRHLRRQRRLRRGALLLRRVVRGREPLQRELPPGPGLLGVQRPLPGHQGFLAQVTCDPGTLAVFEPAGNIDDTCDFSKVTCKCEPLPPLSANDVGRHSNLAVLSDGSAYVSAYDGDHGDLVVVAFDATGQETGGTWVDGVPATGTVVADRNGPRGGRAESGPRRGPVHRHRRRGRRHPPRELLRRGQRRPQVRPAQRRQLEHPDRRRRRRRGPVHQHRPRRRRRPGHRLLPGGRHRQRRLHHRPQGGPGEESGAHQRLRLGPGHRGHRRHHPRPCGGSCGSGTVCVDPGSGATCTATSGACSPACAWARPASTMAAAAAPAGPSSRPGASRASPRAWGLMPSLVVDGSGNLDVAYYDHTDGTLKVALGVDPATGTKGTVKTITGGSGTDQGRFPLGGHRRLGQPGGGLPGHQRPQREVRGGGLGRHGERQRHRRRRAPGPRQPTPWWATTTPC